MQFEELMRLTLSCKSQEVEPSPDLWQKVQPGLVSGREPVLVTVYRKFINRLSPWPPVWRKALAGALGGILLIGTLTLSVSPDAQAWAREKLNIMLYKTVRTVDGYSVVKVNPDEVIQLQAGGGVVGFAAGQAMADPPKSPEEARERAEQIRDQFFKESGASVPEMKLKEAKPARTCATTAEAEAIAGFPVSLPTYLPDGYRSPEITADRTEDGKAFVNVLYRPQAADGRMVLHLMLTKERGFLQGGDARREVRVGNTPGYLSEHPVMTVTGQNSEPTAKAGYRLAWEKNGVVYTLMGNGSISPEEMIRMATSVK